MCVQSQPLFPEGVPDSCKLSEERSKTRNDVADKLGKLMERWEQRITDRNRRFADRFCTGEIHLLLLFRDSETGKVWIACLERNPANDSLFTRQQNETVFVGIVELAEQPERIVPILVRLEPINSLYRLPPRTLYASSLSGFVARKGIEYRELNIRPLFGSGFSRLNSYADKLKCEMVKSTSKVVDDIASRKRNVESVDIEWVDFKNWLHALGLSLCADRLEGCFAKRLDSRFEFIEVLLGPFNFYADQSQSVVGKHFLG